MPSVHVAWPLGQHPTTLLSTSITQCDPAPHVAGSCESPPMNPHTVLRPSCRRRRSKGFCGAGVAARRGKGTTLRAWWASVVVGGGVRRGSGMIWAAVRGSRALSRRMAVGGGSRSKMSALMVPRCDGEGVKTCGCRCMCVLGGYPSHSFGDRGRPRSRCRRRWQGMTIRGLERMGAETKGGGKTLQQ